MPLLENKLKQDIVIKKKKNKQYEVGNNPPVRYLVLRGMILSL